MSIIFEHEKASVWSPSLAVGETFRSMTHTFASQHAIPTGLVWIADDMARIERPLFADFVSTLLRTYNESTHFVFRSFLHGFLAVAIVLLQRCDGVIEGVDAELHAHVEECSARMAWS